MEAIRKSANRGLLVANGWIQAVAIVVVFGFFALGLLAYRTYKDEPPIPARTVGETGEVLFTTRTWLRARECSSAMALWSTARSSATAPISAPISPPIISTVRLFT